MQLALFVSQPRASPSFFHRFPLSLRTRLDSVGGSTNVVYPSCVPSRKKNRVLFDPRVVRVVSRITRGAESLLIDHDRLDRSPARRICEFALYSSRIPRSAMPSRADEAPRR